MSQTTTTTTKFPRTLFPVVCARHGHRPLAYTACLCVLKGFTSVATFIRARPDRMGQVMCDPAWPLEHGSGKRKDHAMDKGAAIEVVLVCDLCVKEDGLDRIGAKISNVKREGQ